MNKAEMTDHYEQYQKKHRDAILAENEGAYREAVKIALSSWEHIDGMMQYTHKYEKIEITSVATIDLILKYAPPRLDSTSLDSLEDLLRDCRRIEKNTSDAISNKLSEARVLMRLAHRMWDHLEFHPGASHEELRKVSEDKSKRWLKILELWEEMGLVERTMDGHLPKISPRTRMGQIVSAKCSSCASKTEAPKAMFLEAMTCPNCHSKVSFVLLAH